VTAWLGTFTLAAAFCAALVGAALWGRSATTGGAAPARWTVVLPLVGATASVGALETALLSHDFAVRFVAENGSRATNAYYTVTSLWAAHDGSLLLWVLILAAYLCFVGVRGHRVPLAGTSPALGRWAVAVLAATTAFFCGLALFTGHVFDTVSPVPHDGPGPNPLLADHPAMGIHPPLLYTGLLGTAVPFAFAVAGLITGEVGPRWLAAVRSSALFAWTTLTAGIVMGAWWSYAVLGWGGYWAWDPVENASLMPWLVLTALLHSAMVQRRRSALPVWNLSLAVAAFLLAALGSFLTRSGVVSSVHSFAASAVGPVLLGFLAAVVVGVALLVLLRGDRLATPEPVGPPLSRGSALLLNNLLLLCVTVVVLLGTLFPLLVQTLSGTEVSVGPPFFDRTAVPVLVVLLLLMAVGPSMSWRGDTLTTVLSRLVVPACVGAVVVVTLSLLAPTGPLTTSALGLASVVASSTLLDVWGRVRRRRVQGSGWPRALARWLHEDRRRAAGLVAHLGLVLAAVGIAASSAYTATYERTLRAGEQAALPGGRVELLSVGRHRSAQAMSTQARLRVTSGSGAVVTEPALRFFPGRGMTVAVPALVSRVGGDLYVTLLSSQGDGQATVRISRKPLVGWVWAGGAVMAAGGAAALWPGRARRRPPRQVPEPEVRAPEPVP